MKKIRKRICKYVVMLLCFGIIVLVSANVRAKEKEPVSTARMYLGAAVNAGNGDGYSEKNEIDIDDPHYNWKLGEFYIGGFTRVIDEKSGSPIFLKNVGDKVKLSFILNQDIDKLNGNDELSIEQDENGYDEHFGIPKTDFGKGMLVIRHTNYQNKTEEPVLHKNYLESVKVKADTEVELCEEGDYEVALDYEIDVDNGIQFWKQGTYDYRIYFKFSVRNGNCMVYPFDTVNKNELTNTSVTENGFYLDLAKSKYLDINVKKEVLKEGAEGLVEDTRFNMPASDGESYTDEGVYTITAKNRYTNQTTTKIIYVGTNDLLKAHVTTNLSLKEIKKQMAQGAKINADGSINYESADIAGMSMASETEEVTFLSRLLKIVRMPRVWIVIGSVFILILALCFIKKEKNSRKENDTKENVAESEANEK